MKIKNILICILLIIIPTGLYYYNSNGKKTLSTSFEIGQPVDSLNEVIVYYNGNVSHTAGRTLSEDGYNIGLKYQCVEFVKRYYYQCLNHKMPDSYGHAKDFFDETIADGQLNKKRNLLQYENGSRLKPQMNDLVIFDKTFYNPYGHVAIISSVNDQTLEIIQQNPGANAKSRVNYKLNFKDSFWYIDSNRCLGWLRKQP